jgi:hypothetical protein
MNSRTACLCSFHAAEERRLSWPASLTPVVAMTSIIDPQLYLYLSQLLTNLPRTSSRPSTLATRQMETAPPLQSRNQEDVTPCAGSLCFTYRSQSLTLITKLVPHRYSCRTGLQVHPTSQAGHANDGFRGLFATKKRFWTTNGKIAVPAESTKLINPAPMRVSLTTRGSFLS